MLIKKANQSVVLHSTRATTSTTAKPKNPFSPESSVSFHGSFKSPNLDFGGFNISRYGHLRPVAQNMPIKVHLKKPVVPIDLGSHSDTIDQPMRHRLSSYEDTNPPDYIDDQEEPAPDMLHYAVQGNLKHLLQLCYRVTLYLKNALNVEIFEIRSARAKINAEAKEQSVWPKNSR